MNMHVTPETLKGHGGGCDSLADKFGQLTDLLEQARVDDQCFGPVGEMVGISKSYFDSLQECQDLATKAQDFLVRTKETLDETLRTHEEIDQKIAEQLETIGKELGA